MGCSFTSVIETVLVLYEREREGDTLYVSNSKESMTSMLPY